jgi:hypothetical protein
MTIREIWPEDYPIFDQGVYSFDQYKENFKKGICDAEKRKRY